MPFFYLFVIIEQHNFICLPLNDSLLQMIKTADYSIINFYSQWWKRKYNCSIEGLIEQSLMPFCFSFRLFPLKATTADYMCQFPLVICIALTHVCPHHINTPLWSSPIPPFCQFHPQYPVPDISNIISVSLPITCTHSRFDSL